MNVNLLIDAITRQTMVLVAQLATMHGARAQLATVANQVFLDLVNELKHQGLGRKVIADMFGLSLRTYHDKVQRLSESATDRGRSLWEAVLGYLEEHEVASRADVLQRFCRDDEASVRGVLGRVTASRPRKRSARWEGGRIRRRRTRSSGSRSTTTRRSRGPRCARSSAWTARCSTRRSIASSRKAA